ncbi:cellulose synthase/poly-beta-1,6-N-acetylglucosamine synthase-like glycosyltransferase [Devosia subaequoris]|uniref:Cellulose synthase/poly-beta-1,6-N-acetylglucosamine synthase-like glycosyltransferase n=1 Tax=Devosia subaequoris TaxID=395930 RepID=A0A7W6INI1_9HYPH|nr:glycosyltransferase family 2 protein [Devosia subaequoris]MBB4052880.1 cellulose synthase/poly-beta-1,6-N-acetylglucosamine synthase-like glycosyltransferase [Devosia subaequoris]MCP1210299.1 glycosyltransferase [Devosia subaequoris]
MSQAVALLQTILGPHTSVALARATLDQALAAEVDPLHWCAIHLDQSAAQIMARAAGWAGLSFLDTVPGHGEACLETGRMEALGQVRLFRTRLHDREVAFAAPDFLGVLRLARLRQERPHLCRTIFLVPESALRTFLVDHAGPALIDSARQNMARFWPRAAAQLELTAPVRHGFAAILVLAALAILCTPLVGPALLAPIWFALVMLPTLLRLLALAVPQQEVLPTRRTDNADLPVYSILVPLRDEANMVPQLFQTLRALDYPVEKLDIVFVVESRSPRTIQALRRHLPDPRFAVRIVPDALPRTKPKALDFALPLCRGEFVVVYDAEDRPEPDQLRRIVDQFVKQPELECIQARLVIDNADQGWLPALFAGEYAGLFSVLLPALARWGLVMPLGGTSNHFRLETLRGLGGWDAFNVTEDADLGVRLARRKLRCATSTARTFEAAPTHLRPWLGQRTRWMKGWMQTYAVHNRHPEDLLADLGWRGMAGLQLVLLGMVLTPLLHAGFLLSLPLLYFTGQLAGSAFHPWSLACLAVLLLGSAVAIAVNLVGLSRSRQAEVSRWQALVPAYWALIAFSTVLALRDFTQRPFHWFKSPHHASTDPVDPTRAETGRRAVSVVQPAGNTFQRRGRKPIRDRSAAG